MDNSSIIRAARDLLARERMQDALDLVTQARTKTPDDVELLLAAAEILTELDRPAEATATYRRVLVLDSQNTIAAARVAEATAAMETLLRLAFIADEARAFDEARENYEAVLYQEPLSVFALTRLLAIDGQEGRFTDAERHHAALVHALGAAELRAVHHNNLATILYQSIFRPLPRPIHDAVRSALSRHVMALAEKFGPPPAPLPKPGPRLRIGYLSIHFRDHPVGHVTAALFAAHDRTHFEVYVFYLPAGEPNPYTAQIKAGAEHFHVAREPEEMLRLIARQNLDVLVYLDGYMAPFLLPVIARRPAPVQVYWLGHAGSCEMPGIDSFIADETVVPPGEEALYSAKVVRLPVYHPASPHSVATDMSRAEAGLPDGGFVFCAFNNPEKIDTPTFELWMRVLARVPDSWLWLSRSQSPSIASNLREAAQARGVSGERLIFADRLPDKARHLARHRHAGLFLDTLGLNASATALDALWAGLPVLTVTGPRFAGRIATTFLRTLGLTDMACQSLQSFEDRAVRLATNPKELADVRGRLAISRRDRPLFQIEAFCRTLEDALRRLAKGQKQT